MEEAQAWLAAAPFLAPQNRGGVKSTSQRTNNSEGRHLVASCKLPAGYSVYSGTAHAAAIYDEYTERVCAHCLKIARNGETYPFKCRSCNLVYYCSEDCQRGDRQRHNELMCPALQKLAPILESGYDIVKARLILQILAQLYDDDEPSLRNEIAELHLHEPMEKMGLHSAASDAFCDGLRSAIAACKWSKSVPPSALTNAEFLKWASIIDTNGFDCKTKETDGNSIGIGIYLNGATLFNHSCDPNCKVYHSMPELYITTTRPVAKGEALTFAYIDVKQDRITRRDRLLESYSFECRCPRCVKEEEVALEWERLAQVGPWLVAVGAALVTTVAFGMYPVVATAYLFDRLSPWFVYE